MKSKFKIGDKVRIVRYGHLLWSSKNHESPMVTGFPVIFEDDTFTYHDMRPELLGKKMIVVEVSICQGKSGYVLDNEGGSDRMAWFSDQQLELIE